MTAAVDGAAACDNILGPHRLHTAIGGVPPAEFEAAYYVQSQPDPETGSNT
jgi:hypothetical protein